MPGQGTASYNSGSRVRVAKSPGRERKARESTERGGQDRVPQVTGGPAFGAQTQREETKRKHRERRPGEGEKTGASPQKG